MYQICVTIAGRRHCFPAPTLILKEQIKRPPPNNLPPFELAASVLMLVESVPKSELSTQLTEVATRYINDLQKQLPAGVGISPIKE